VVKSYKGIFKPTNPEKYVGDPNRIIYRSGLELRFFKIVDRSTSITKWASEEFNIKYLSPVDNQIHRYFVDLFIEVNNQKKYFIEIKPHSQTMPPKKPKKETPRYLKECLDFEVNQAKWKAATSFCREKNMDFLVITEKNLPRIL
jgi:hypothetical protein